MPNLRYKAITSLNESSLQQGALVAGTDNGFLVLTQDDGKTWNAIDTGLPRASFTRSIFSTHKKNTIYVTLSGMLVDDFSPYVFRSDDAGKTWQDLSKGLPKEPVQVIHEDPRDPQILYLGTDAGVYVTSNGGSSWESLSNHLPNASVHDLFVHPRELELVAGTHGRSVYILDVKGIKKKKQDDQ